MSGLQLGKGKWKKILDEAGDIFKSRSQVDLKDKWRNLERQGIVQAPVKADPGQGDKQSTANIECSGTWHNLQFFGHHFTVVILKGVGHASCL